MTNNSQERVLEYGNTRLKKNGYTVSGHFFDLFTWKFIKGSPASAITDPSSIVLSESAAKAYFGNEDAINKVMKIDNNKSVRVSAVVADAPGNSTFAFDFVQPFNYSDTLLKAQMNQWYNSSWNVFIQAAPGASQASIEKIINDV